MTRCLDEATLQSYFDGELSISAMESATLHLASCNACALAAQEIEQETLLLTEALAAEFEASVPTERLRQRIDAAVLEMRLETAKASIVAPRAGFLSSLFSFGSSRSLGYASLVLVLMFAAVLGVLKLKSSAPSETPVDRSVAWVRNPNDVPARVVPPRENITPVMNQPIEVANVPVPRKVKFVSSPRPSTNAANTAETANIVKSVKLIPGERSYLQAIARLNTAIKSDKQAMRPALQVEYERNLAVVDRAIAATRNAAKSNPSDPDAADFMFAAYQSKVDLLNTIADARVGGRSH
jgi:hypothetical protein